MAYLSDKESGGKPAHSKVVECGDLRVVFYWLGDRFGHRLEQRVESAWRTLVESVEDSPDAEWPSSPVLQNLHIEDRASGKVALLVGKAAKSHWSASVEAEPAHARLVFDVACRVSESPHWLGGAYRAIAAEPLPIDITAIANESIIDNLSGSSANQWRIRPVDFPAEWPRTVRWRYAIALVGLIGPSAALQVNR